MQVGGYFVGYQSVLIANVREEKEQKPANNKESWATWPVIHMYTHFGCGN